MVYSVSSYCPTLVFYLPNLNSPLTVHWKLLWKHSVTGRRYKRALLQSSVLFIKAGCDEPALLDLNHGPSPSLINTPRTLTSRCCCCCCFPATERNVNALVVVSPKCCTLFINRLCTCVFNLHTGMFLFAWVCLSANAHSCLLARANVGVSLFILTSVCVLVVCVCVILLREIISSNVHWPDSLPVLGFFRCINILEESPGETESLCKHNHRGSVRELLARASLSGTEEFAAHGVFSSHTYIQIDF